MASPALSAANDKIEKILEDKRKLADKKNDELEDKDLTIRKLKKELRGPDYQQMGADTGGLVVGEILYRLINAGLAKLGLRHPVWFTLPHGVAGSVLYVLCYPRKDEGVVRSVARSVGLVWQIAATHDGVGFVLDGRARSSNITAALADENAKLKAALAQVAQQQQGKGG